MRNSIYLKTFNLKITEDLKERFQKDMFRTIENALCETTTEQFVEKYGNTLETHFENHGAIYTIHIDCYKECLGFYSGLFGKICNIIKGLFHLTIDRNPDVVMQARLFFPDKTGYYYNWEFRNRKTVNHLYGMFFTKGPVFKIDAKDFNA